MGFCYMCISMKLKCLSILLLLNWIFLSARPWALAADPGGETRARTETEMLRQRIAELEEQNAIIHRQLVEIQKRLDLSPLGMDYIYWKTNFIGLEKGTDNRVNLYLIYNFQA